VSAAERVESIKLALLHHELSRAVISWSPPGPGHPKWLVRLAGNNGRDEFTTPQADALCQGLAAGERRWRYGEDAT
jgi:hypothetical protein